MLAMDNSNPAHTREFNAEERVAFNRAMDRGRQLCRNGHKREESNTGFVRGKSGNLHLRCLQCKREHVPTPPTPEELRRQKFFKAVERNEQIRQANKIWAAKVASPEYRQMLFEEAWIGVLEYARTNILRAMIVDMLPHLRALRSISACADGIEKVYDAQGWPLPRRDAKIITGRDVDSVYRFRDMLHSCHKEVEITCSVETDAPLRAREGCSGYPDYKANVEVRDGEINHFRDYDQIEWAGKWLVETARAIKIDDDREHLIGIGCLDAIQQALVYINEQARLPETEEDPPQWPLQKSKRRSSLVSL